MENNYNRYEFENSGIKIILEMPLKNVNDERMLKELKNILSNTLSERLKRIF